MQLSRRELFKASIAAGASIFLPCAHLFAQDGPLIQKKDSFERREPADHRPGDRSPLRGDHVRGRASSPEGDLAAVQGAGR